MSNERSASSKNHLSHTICDDSGYSGHKSRANMNSNAYSETSDRTSSLCSHETDYTEMTTNLGDQSGNQIVVGAERCTSIQLTGDESSSTSGATAILKPTCELVNSEHNVDTISAINNADSSSPVLSNLHCGSTSSLKRALVNRNQCPSSSGCDVSSLHLNHKCLHIAEDHHICREESQHFNPTNPAKSFRNSPHCVHSPRNHLGLGACWHSQELHPSQFRCLSPSGSHLQHTNPSGESTNAGALHGTRNSSTPCDCSSCCVPAPVNSCHCASYRYTNQTNPSSSSDINCFIRTNSGCSHGHNNCGNGSLLLRDSFNSSCDVHGNGAGSAVCDFSPSLTPMPTVNSCSDSHQVALGGLSQFLPINAADIAVSWASNGSGGLSGFVYTNSGSSENSSHNCCSGTTEMRNDSHRQHPTSGCTASPHLSSTSWPKHSGGCHAYQNNSHFAATQMDNNTHSSGILSHHCDSSSNNAICRRTHALSSPIYGTAAVRECSNAQHIDGAEALGSSANPSQQHRLTVPQDSHNSPNTLIRPAQHLPAHYQNLSGSATSLHSFGSHGSGCGHWCSSCQVKLAQGSGPTLCNRSVGGSERTVRGGCSSRAVKHLPSCNGLAIQPSSTDMHSIDTKSSNSLDTNASPKPWQSLKNKIHKLAKHRRRIPSGGKETSGSITKKKKPAFPFLMTCLSQMTKAPLNGINVPSLTSAADGTNSPSEPSELVPATAAVASTTFQNDPAQRNRSNSNGVAPCSYTENRSSGSLERGAVTQCDAHPDNSLSQIPLATLLGILPRNTSLEREVYTSDNEPRYTRDSARAAASNNVEHRANGTVPLNINTMLGLQMLIEQSLRLDLASHSSLPQERISHHLERLHSIMDEEASVSFNSNAQRTVHTQVDYIHFLVPDLLSITSCSFYWGKMDRYKAELLLDKRPEGTFLLRDSAQDEYLFSVSFRRFGKSLHARIEQGNHKFSFLSLGPGVFASDTVCGLVEHYKDPSCCMFIEPLLTNPLCRSFPFPLQHLCRATICSNSTYDGINKLELPKPLRQYLKEYHYKQLVRVRRLDH